MIIKVIDGKYKGMYGTVIRTYLKLSMSVIRIGDIITTMPNSYMKKVN